MRFGLFHAKMWKNANFSQHSRVICRNFANFAHISNIYVIYSLLRVPKLIRIRTRKSAHANLIKMRKNYIFYTGLTIWENLIDLVTCNRLWLKKLNRSTYIGSKCHDINKIDSIEVPTLTASSSTQSSSSRERKTRPTGKEDAANNYTSSAL